MSQIYSNDSTASKWSHKAALMSSLFTPEPNPQVVCIFSSFTPTLCFGKHILNSYAYWYIGYSIVTQSCYHKFIFQIVCMEWAIGMTVLDISHHIECVRSWLCRQIHDAQSRPQTLLTNWPQLIVGLSWKCTPFYISSTFVFYQINPSWKSITDQTQSATIWYVMPFFPSWLMLYECYIACRVLVVS